MPSGTSTTPDRDTAPPSDSRVLPGSASEPVAPRAKAQQHRELRERLDVAEDRAVGTGVDAPTRGDGRPAANRPHHGAGFTADKATWYSMNPHDACVGAFRDGGPDRISTERVVHRERHPMAPSE